jgi:hypothetical protein
MAKKGLMANRSKAAQDRPAAAAPAKKKKLAAGGKKRLSSQLAMRLSQSRAHKIAGDLYEAAALDIWATAIEAAPEPRRAELIRLQDAICDAADHLREARSANPRHLRLYSVACFDRAGLPTTPPHFVAAANEAEALEIWRTAFKGSYGRKTPHARLVPELGAAPGVRE